LKNQSFAGTMRKTEKERERERERGREREKEKVAREIGKGWEKTARVHSP